MFAEHPVSAVGGVIQGIMGVMGIYYALSLPYCKAATGALLVIQHELLGDYVHRADQKVLDRGMLDFKNATTQEML